MTAPADFRALLTEAVSVGYRAGLLAGGQAQAAASPPPVAHRETIQTDGIAPLVRAAREAVRALADGPARSALLDALAYFENVR